MIGVTAPFEWRINRVMKRDGISRTAVLERMAKQMDENEKIQRCQFVIKNDETQLLIPQVFQLHKQFLAMAKLTV